MPYGRKTKKKTCSSYGGTRKQRGGLFGKLKGLVSKANQKLDAAQSAIANHSLTEKLTTATAKKVTEAKAAAAAVANHPQVRNLSEFAANKINAGVAILSQHKQNMMESKVTQGLKDKATKHLDNLKKHVDNAHTIVKNKVQTVCKSVAPKPNADEGIEMTKMGGRKKKRGHKKRHATKKRGHKKRGHKKSHKKRGHKKHRGSRKRRGGAPCLCNA